MKDSKTSKEVSNQPFAVKLRGSGARVDVTPSEEEIKSPMFTETLMEEVLDRRNMFEALKRVKQNKGAPGVDGVTVESLDAFLKKEWPAIKEQLLTGGYQPRPILRVEIPKPGKKEKRKLGIPCCVDRVIQQALLQILSPKWDREFSENSFGFRPGRGCHKAIARAQEYLRSGNEWVVDIDLSKFFDRVHHDRLMSRLMREIPDKRVLSLIRRYLQAGIMEDGLISIPTQGTPQGSPLSPLLSNIVLDELDRELTKRGLQFVRYADDCNIYVRSERAGKRVMQSITRFIEGKLRLKVNEEKSAVARPQDRSFLGFTFTGGQRANRRKISTESIHRFKSEIKRLTRRRWGISIDERIARLNKYLRGWKGYYDYTEATSIFQDLDKWIRHRVRCCQWKSWKTYRNRKRSLMALNVPEPVAWATAWSSKGPWRISNAPGVKMALSNKYFRELKLFTLSS